jgi:8-oxo-dGTP pyrophosphatase MutT (NUDIX family)
MQGEVLFREHGKQVAALCWRHSPKRNSQLEILLVTSLNSKRWILPKGGLEPELSPAENAAREAFEEAGVTGKVSPHPIGAYHYLKEKKDGGGMPCAVEVFALAVTKQLDDWPEKNARELAWVPVEQAAARLSEPGLRQILKDFRKQQAPPKERRTAVSR